MNWSRVADLEKRLEQHYERELDLIHEASELSNDEIQELGKCIIANPIYQKLLLSADLKELMDLTNALRNKGGDAN